MGENDNGGLAHAHLTLRDYFAAKVLAALVSADPTDTDEKRAEWAYAQADAMLAERQK